MGDSAVGLVVAAAAIHALWNVLAKRGHDKLAFIWWTAVVGSLLLFPVVAVAGSWPQWTPRLVLQTALAAVLRAAYFATLSAAYARGDLSLVYPLARSVAPVVAPMLAVIALHETLTAANFTGIVCVTAGVYVVHATGFRPRALLSPFAALGQPHARFALLTGGITAVYSVVDKWSIDAGLSPAWYAYLTIPVAGLLLTPWPWRDPARTLGELRHHPAAIAGVAVMMPAAYLLILHALRVAPVSVVAPARELSIVFGTILAVAGLGEGHWPQRLAGSALIVAGVAVLTAAAR